jgi:thioredoxin 1
MNKKIYYFSAPWCGPCKMMGPVMDSLASQINFTKINVDSEGELASQYNIRNIPTFVLIENGMEKNRISGMKSKEEILNFYNG